MAFPKPGRHRRNILRMFGATDASINLYLIPGISKEMVSLHTNQMVFLPETTPHPKNLPPILTSLTTISETCGTISNETTTFPHSQDSGPPGTGHISSPAASLRELPPGSTSISRSTSASSNTLRLVLVLGFWQWVK